MSKLSYRSPLYWLTLVVAVGIIFIGVRFLFAPDVAARAFGISLANPRDVAFLFVKGVRDIVSGLLFLALLWSGEPRLTGALLLIATLIPNAAVPNKWCESDIGRYDGSFRNLTYRLEVGMLRLSSVFVVLIVLISAFLTCAALGQNTPSSATVTCSFDADRELTADYQRISFNLKKPLLGGEIPYGKAWAPGGKPLTLFTNSNVEIGGKMLPVGAYTMFVLPTPKQWTLIISKSTDLTGRYDEHQDLVRVAMESGEVPMPEPQFSASFAHVAPNQCSLRLVMAKSGNWVTFERK